MPIESRFDELDLREEPADAVGAAKELLYSHPNMCPTTTVQHTFDC